MVIIMQTRFFFATQCCFLYTGNSAFMVPKVVATRSGFLILLLPEYGSLIDTTIADRYRCRLFIRLYYRGKKIIVMSPAGYFLYCWQTHANFTSSVPCRSIRSYVYWTSHRL
jgi:hypothetical protein